MPEHKGSEDAPRHTEGRGTPAGFRPAGCLPSCLPTPGSWRRGWGWLRRPRTYKSLPRLKGILPERHARRWGRSQGGGFPPQSCTPHRWTHFAVMSGQPGWTGAIQCGSSAVAGVLRNGVLRLDHWGQGQVAGQRHPSVRFIAPKCMQTQAGARWSAWSLSCGAQQGPVVNAAAPCLLATPPEGVVGQGQLPAPKLM